MKPVFPSLLLSTVLLGAGFAAQAQTPPASPSPPDHPPMHGMDHKGPGGHWGRMDPAKMEAMHAKHMADFKARLKITPAQEPAWTAFTTAMKPPARPAEGERPDRAAFDKLTTPERIDKMRELRAKHQAERQAAMDQREQAIKTFYATLNPEQKKVMDEEHTRMARAMEHRRGGHGGDGKKTPPTPPVPPTPPAGK